MKNFLKGIIFISLILPIIEGIVSLYNQAIEFFCLKITKKCYNIKTEIEKENNDCPIETQAIGFHIPNEEFCNDEEGEENT